MDALRLRNQKIIDAILEKERATCPGSIALIGVYGSFLTGDYHPLSDLDLLILIRDEQGRQLATAFIQDDSGVGHDIYCTSWESLRQDACYTHPHIGKLMDSQIVYCAEDTYRNELDALRDKVWKRLAEPFGEADYRNAENTWKEARECYALAMIAEQLSDIRVQAGGVLYFTENAVALLNKTYFRRGVRRCCEELAAMNIRPKNLCERIEHIAAAETAAQLKEQLTLLMREMTECFLNVRKGIQPEKKTADAESLVGTYEEMVSNWRGKMLLAAETGDRHLALMSLSSLHEMMSDLRSTVDLQAYDVLSAYHPEDLMKTAKECDRILQAYLQEYKKVGLTVNRYPDIDAFVSAYLSSDRKRQGKDLSEQ